jgi:hypothetical protein
MKKYPDVSELYKRKEANRKSEAKRSISEKLAIASKLRDFQDKLAPIRAANKAERLRRKVTVRVKSDHE